jgi:hypothetical protein
VCDPDTGLCGPAAQAGVGSAATAGAPVGAVIPTTLDGDSGWGSKQALILIVILFTLALVFIPAYAWRRLSAPPAMPSNAPIDQAVAREQVTV